jgi:hypothetical protein
VGVRVNCVFHSQNIGLQRAHGYAKSGAMPTDPPPQPKPPLTPAAQRALAEAAARRAEHAGKAEEQPKEVNGPGGPEPTRYGDWEINGITSDF